MNKKTNFLKKYILLAFAFLVSHVGYAQANNENSKQPDILDSLISITIILFIISVITEKITQLVRKYSPFMKARDDNKLTKMAGTYWQNINKKQTGENPELDKRVEREVNSLSFIIGLFIALLFRVDLFKMFQAPDPREVLFWSDKVAYTGFEMLTFAVSIGLTGFFLTFGSKFFHDLLDTLFQAKNLKRKLVDDNTFQAESIQQFDEYIEKSYSDIIETAIQQNQQLLTNGDNTIPAMHGKMIKEGKLVDCIDIHIKGNNRGNIPSLVQAKLSKGQIIHVPVNVIYDVETPEIHAAQGNTVANSNSANFKGTICCKLNRVGNAQVSLLTCSHVMTKGSGKNSFGEITDPIPAETSNNPDGNFIWALCNDQFDIALVNPSSDNFTYKIPPGKERKLTPSDILSMNVKVVRQEGRGISEGAIVNYSCPRAVPIKYADGEFGIINLILLSKVTRTGDGNSYVTLTAPGDSGSCVYDDQNRPIGMIVAGNSKFSYAIPMVDILQRLSASIIP